MQTADLAARRKRIMRGRRIKRRKFLMKLLFFIVELVVISVLLRYSSLFNIQEVFVEGNYETEKNNLIKLSGIEIGENLFALDTKEVKKALLSEPMIKNAYIKKEYVNKVNIVVEERIPLARFHFAGKYYYTDSELNILTQKPTKGDTLLIDGFLKNTPEDGKLYPKEALKEPEYLFIEKLLNEHDIAKISKVVRQGEEIDIFLEEGTIIRFGNIVNYSYKLDLLSELLNDAKERGLDLKLVDMTKGKHPIVLLKEDEPIEK